MSVKVHLYSSLQSYTDGQGTVEVNGNTVGQCLDDLMRCYPRLKPALFDKDSKLLPQVFVSINLNSARPEDLAKQVTDKDELYIILVIAGG